jgi:hypothetical protein
VSDAEGRVAIPKVDASRVRLRVGLRSEEPTEIDVATLDGGAAEVAAPSTLLPVTAGERLPTTRAHTTAASDASAGALTLRFSRLAVLPLESKPAAAGAPTDMPVDFFQAPTPSAAGVRYGALLEREL